MKEAYLYTPASTFYKKVEEIEKNSPKFQKFIILGQKLPSKASGLEDTTI